MEYKKDAERTKELLSAIPSLPAVTGSGLYDGTDGSVTIVHDTATGPVGVTYIGRGEMETFVSALLEAAVSAEARYQAKIRE